jgi:uridylate kinase
MQEPPIVISVGGSLIVPNGGINTNFLIKLNRFIRDEVAKGRRFFLVSGGGKLCRHYQEAGKTVIGNLTHEDLDWLGIHVTHLNGQLLRTIFQDIANPRVIQHYDRKLVDWKEPVVIGAGWLPGCSTDYDAVKLAQDYGGKLIINMSNVDWVYDKDPAKFSDAKPIKKITWEEMEKLVGDKWSPGFNSPFDPSAIKLAKKLKLTVVIANGNDLKNIQKIINKDSFNGTVISSKHDS